MSEYEIHMVVQEGDTERELQPVVFFGLDSLVEATWRANEYAEKRGARVTRVVAAGQQSTASLTGVVTPLEG